MNSKKTKIAILGDGGWGTALALTLLHNNNQVTVWGPFPDYIRQVRTDGINELYLPGVKLPPELKWTDDREDALKGATIVVLAIPTKYFRTTLMTFKGLIPRQAAIISVSKGLDPSTSRRMTDVAAELLNHAPVAALSGPSHAEEVARRVPTAVVIACADHERARMLQKVFMTPWFRIYTSDDVIGVEMGGALKNVIALGVGVSDGIGFGNNTRAALITRGLAEIARLGVALGANPHTFAGLSGMGDLIVTCTSGLSRNHTVGERIGRGEKIDQILAGMKQVAEGVTTASTARTLALARHIDALIIEQVCALLHENKNPQRAVEDLMLRNARPERD